MRFKCHFIVKAASDHAAVVHDGIFQCENRNGQVGDYRNELALSTALPAMFDCRNHEEKKHPVSAGSVVSNKDISSSKEISAAERNLYFKSGYFCAIKRLMS